jgi:integrase
MIFRTHSDEVLEALNIRQKTLATYRSIYRRHIDKELGAKLIGTITRLDVRAVIKPLTPQTSAMTLAVMKTLFREGISRGLIQDSPAEGVKTPTIYVRPRPFMTTEELIRADLGKYRSQILFLAFHGLRWSEAVALTEADIYGGKVHINKSTYGDTKSPAGVREVPLVTEFKVFPKTPKGIRKICHENGIRIHSLRHSYAYLLKQSGVHVTTAQRLLGHSDPKVTLGIYTGFRQEEIQEAGKLILNHSSQTV